MDVAIRTMTVEDAEAVAEVRVRSWQWAYQGVLPQAYLDALSIEEDADRRRKVALDDAGRVVRLVAEDPAGRILGFISLGPYREDDAPAGDGELYAIYVLPQHVGGRVGRALLKAGLEAIAHHGWPTLRLWVFRDNARARRFYERAGFTPDGTEEPYDAAGVLVPGVRYALERPGGA